MPSRAEIEMALCTAVEKDPALDSAGIIFAQNGVAQILRHPSAISEPYIYCTAGPDMTTASPEPPLQTQWRSPWSPSESRFDVPYDPSRSDARGTTETTHDLVNFGLDLVVLALGVGVIAMTGGVGAIGLLAGLQLGAGSVLALNDGVRSVSDFADHGAVGRFEDDDPHYSSYFRGMTDIAVVVQFLDGDGFIDAMRGFDVTKMTLADTKRLLHGFGPIHDWLDATEALEKSKSGLREAIRGNIGPGQRVRLGKLLNVGGRKAKIATIQKILALKVANDFGASLITLGQASYGGPISDLYGALPHFQFSLIFLNNQNSIRISSHDHYNDWENDMNPGEGARYNPGAGMHPQN